MLHILFFIFNCILVCIFKFVYIPIFEVLSFGRNTWNLLNQQIFKDSVGRKGSHGSGNYCSIQIKSGPASRGPDQTSKYLLRLNGCRCCLKRCLGVCCAGAVTAGACVFCVAGTYQTGSGPPWQHAILTHSDFFREKLPIPHASTVSNFWGPLFCFMLSIKKLTIEAAWFKQTEFLV